MKNWISKHRLIIRRAILKSILLLYLMMVVVLIYGVTFSIMSSVRYARSFAGSQMVNNEDLIAHDTRLDGLTARHALLEAQSRLVDADSVSLVVDLADSLITIEYKGVVLHTAKIDRMNLSRVFKRIDKADLSYALSSPLTIHETASTIERVRYKVKVAPADSSLTLPAVLPDTSMNEVVFYRFGLDRGIQLDIRQTTNGDRDMSKKFKQQIHRRESLRIINDLLAFRVPEYHPVIQVDVSQEDARSIYKALPVHAKIALGM